jgi:hypothetical protein
MYSRREFIETGLAALGAAALVSPRPVLVGRAPKKILILGGTGFVGPHQVRSLRRHQVTIFNRGRSRACSARIPRNWPGIAPVTLNKDGSGMSRRIRVAQQRPGGSLSANL